MRKPTLAAAVLSLWACSPEDLAALDRHGEAAITELSHVVLVRFEDGAARLTVKRQLRNQGEDFESLSHHLELPRGAIATSLRVGTDGRWPEPATLTSNEDADARWEELTGPGTATPSTLGLLEWSWSGGLDLEIFALAPGSTVTVEYDLQLEPGYRAGELSFEYPQEEPAEGLIAPRFELASGALTALLPEEAEPSSTPEGFRLTSRQDPREVVDARWATYPIETDRTLWRLEIDAASELGSAPVRPNVVFVVDASHSEGPEGIAAQLELIEPYLANARDAQVEVVIYRRFAERLFGQFVPAAEVGRRLAATPITPGNGSNLELGARLAAEALSQMGGTGRVVLFTDEALRFGFSNQVAIEALKAAPAHTVAHLVSRVSGSGGSELSEDRDDGAPLSPIAAAHGGVFLRVIGEVGDPLFSADTLLGLIRPVRIDSFAVEAEGVELSVDTPFYEGEMIRQTAIAAMPGEQVTLTGKLWAKDFKRVVAIDPRLSNRLPGIAVGDEDLRRQLSDDELRTVAHLSHAVSPVTSYLAIPPGAAPSSFGTFGRGYGGIGMSGIGCGGTSCTMGCGWGTARASVDFTGVLRALLAPGLAACEQRHGEAGQMSLLLEATGDELVDVAILAASADLEACLTEAAWGIRLGTEFVTHRTYELTLGD